MGDRRGREEEERGEEVEERSKFVERHWLEQCPEWPFLPIAVAVSADQSVVVQ